MKPLFKWTNNSTEAGDTSGTLVLYRPRPCAESEYLEDPLVLKFESYMLAHELIQYMELVASNAVSNFKADYYKKVRMDLQRV